MKSNCLLPACIMGMTASLIGCSKELPVYRESEKTVWLEQNWSPEQRHWFHHANQGTWTFFIPYEWFAALEQPGFKLFGASDLLADTGYLLRLGFIPGEQGAHNKAGLPVGFAIDYDAIDPASGKKFNSIGLTCAACHTGHMTYKDTSIRYDGGPGMINPNKLMEILFRSMLETEFNPRQFNRFADRVLGAENTPQKKLELKKEYSGKFLE
ncbi:MAG TPA: cytochrome C, partial [Gammaproteobacteria bacterium]